LLHDDGEGIMAGVCGGRRMRVEEKGKQGGRRKKVLHVSSYV
jgi:hypothetical protein